MKATAQRSPLSIDDHQRLFNLVYTLITFQLNKSSVDRLIAAAHRLLVPSPTRTHVLACDLMVKDGLIIYIYWRGNMACIVPEDNHWLCFIVLIFPPLLLMDAFNINVVRWWWWWCVHACWKHDKFGFHCSNMLFILNCGENLGLNPKKL
jgi:hypothetical protein